MVANGSNSFQFYETTFELHEATKSILTYNKTATLFSEFIFQL